MLRMTNEDAFRRAIDEASRSKPETNNVGAHPLVGVVLVDVLGNSLLPDTGVKRGLGITPSSGSSTSVLVRAPESVAARFIRPLNLARGEAEIERPVPIGSLTAGSQKF